MVQTGRVSRANEAPGDEPDSGDLPRDPVILQALRATARRKLRAGGVLFVAALTGTIVAGAYWAEIGRLWRGETDRTGAPIYEAQHEAEPAQDIDWRRVHATLIPRWLIARGHSHRSHSTHGIADFDRAAHAHRAFTELRFAIRSDPNLVSLVDELEERGEDPVANAERIDYLLWAWNAYLDRHDIPWRLEANLHLSREGEATFVTRSYEVLGDLRDDAGRRLRLLRRADLTNVDEGILGHSPGRDEGALVILDETLRFAVRHVWPMLNPGLDAYLPTEQRAVAGPVRSRLRLESAERERLRETAVDQLALVEVAASIHARAECGSRFRVWGLPWNGLAPPDQNALISALDRSRGRECPEVTLGEAARMIGASERLGQTPALADAVESLGTWVARAVAIHELRHVADGGAAVECPGCPESMEGQTRAELSAYLATFATDEVAHVAVLQACAMQPEAHAGSLEPHALALGFALPRLLPDGCDGAIPEDLADRALHLERALFGERDRVRIPESFPDRIPLLAR